MRERFGLHIAQSYNAIDITCTISKKLVFNTKDLTDKLYDLLEDLSKY